MAETQQTALLLGASRGLGLGLAREYLSRGWRVIATARDNAEQLEALQQERERQPAHRARRHRRHRRRRGAARNTQRREARSPVRRRRHLGLGAEPLHEVSPDEAARVFLINAYYPIAAAEAFADLLKPDGTVAFMSSRLGSIELNDYGSWETYRLSKAALNMGARSFFHRHARHAVLSICAGLGAHRHGRAVGDLRRRDQLPQCGECDRHACGQARQPLCELRRHRIAVVDRRQDHSSRAVMPQSDPIDFWFSIGSLLHVPHRDAHRPRGGHDRHPLRLAAVLACAPS